jgi:hypothetical protein
MGAPARTTAPQQYSISRCRNEGVHLALCLVEKMPFRILSNFLSLVRGRSTSPSFVFTQSAVCVVVTCTFNLSLEAVWVLRSGFELPHRTAALAV